MKKILLLPCLLLTISSFGQTPVDSLVRVGIQYHDLGEYEKAIEAYNMALKIAPESALVNYELAMTHMYAGNYEESVKHSDVVIEQKKEYLLPAHIIKGSSLDYLGETTQAIKLFNDALEEYGDNYLLLYNLGISYSRINDYENSESVLIRAITANPNHASSHYSLARLEKGQNQRVKSLLGLYYFLIIEPSSKRAEAAYALLKEQLGGRVQKNEDDTVDINIFFDPQIEESEFSEAELMLAMLEVSNSFDENKDRPQDELFIENTESFFVALGEMRENEKKTSIWWDFYTPFFYELAKTEYMDVFCYYISVSSNEKAKEWLAANDEKLENFVDWVNEY